MSIRRILDARFACALTVWGAAALLPTAAFVACSGSHGEGPSATQSQKGTASVVALSLSSSDVASATVTVSGGTISGSDAGIATPLVFPLQKSGAQWTASLTGIPAGTGFTFTVNALDSNSNVIYSGSAANVAIASGKTTQVAITAQQTAAPTPFVNTVPVISSLVVSSNSVAPGGSVNLSVTAVAPNATDQLTYAWTANGGTFSAPSAASTQWTAPTTPGNYGIILTVTDSEGATVVATTQIAVANATQAIVTVDINTWPVVTNVVGAPNYLVLGQPSDLTAQTSDADNDPITYAWTSSCTDGAFANAGSPTPSFTLPSNSTDTSCTFTVSVADGRGGSDTGSVTLPVGAPTFGKPIAFTTYSQSSQTVSAAGQAVTFAIQATDPTGSALTYTWTASDGTFKNQTNTTSGSQIIWAAPANSAANWTIVVKAQDSAGLSATKTFTVTPTTCFGVVPSSNAWKWAVMADTQWTVTDDGANPDSVAVAIINQLNAQFIANQVKLVVAVGDVTDNGSNLALDVRARAAQALYNAGIAFYPLRGNHEPSAVAAAEFTRVFPQTRTGSNNSSPSDILALTTPDDSTVNPVPPSGLPFNVGTGFSSPLLSLADGGTTSSLAGLSYTFQYNNAQFVLLDQFTPPDSATNTIDMQQSWISSALAGKPNGGHAFVFGHKGLITENHVDVLFGSDPSQDPTGTDAFIKSLAANGVHYYIGGHDHMHNRSIVTTSDGVSASVQDIISASDSSKFYQPGVPANDVVYDVPAFGHTRQTQIAQEIGTVGYYIVTVDGARVSVDFYSAQVNATGPGTPSSEYLIATTPPLAFVKRETYGYGLNGKEFIVAEGASYTTVADSFASTTAAILSGTNMNTAKDASGRALNAAVDTGWTAATCATTSSVLSLWITPTTLGSSQTDTYALQLNAGATPAPAATLASGSFGIATKDANGNWINAVNKNFGGTKTFVSGPWTASAALGSYGIDPATGNAWAVVNYSADFAIAQFTN
jgi:hypothetical protein